jgi:hypothetical protein
VSGTCIIYTLSVFVTTDDDGASYSVELHEHRRGQKGRLVTCADVGPFGLDREVRPQLLLALEEALTYGTETAVALDTRINL